MKSIKWLLLIVMTAGLYAAPQVPQTAPAKKAAGAAKSAAKDTKAAATDAAKLVDLNTASADELKALPGIGDKYSQKIIDNRPYANKSQLVSKKVIPQGVYNKISGMIVAKQK